MSLSIYYKKRCGSIVALDTTSFFAFILRFAVSGSPHNGMRLSDQLSCCAVQFRSSPPKKKKGGDAVQTVLLLIFGTAAIISEFAFRIHNYRLDRQLEQQGGIYDETIYRNRHFDS